MAQFILDNFVMFKGLDDPENHEFEQLSQFANPFEIKNKVHFSQEGLVRYFEELLEREGPNSEDPEIKAKWEVKENLPTFKSAIKESVGTETTIRIDFTFPKAFKMDKIAKAIFDPAIKPQWDDNVEVYEKEDLFDGASNFLVYLSYVRAKKTLGYQLDFYEKGFQCFHNNKYYHWTSAVYDQNENGKRMMSQQKPVPDGIQRGETYYALTVLERITDDPKNMGKIKCTAVSSVDYKVSIPSLVKDPFTKKSMRSWVAELNKFYQKNNKKL